MPDMLILFFKHNLTASGESSVAFRPLMPLKPESRGIHREFQV
jgi:hypothetical protein